MSKRRGVYRPRQVCFARICGSGGNKGYIRGGKAIIRVAPHLGPLAKAVLLAAALTPDVPAREARKGRKQ